MTPEIGIPAILTLTGLLFLVWNDRRKRFIVRSDEFNTAFLPAITKLNRRPGSHRNILAKEFGGHQNAAIVFRQHLGRSRTRFDKAWQAYEAYVKGQTDVPLIEFIATEVTDINKSNDPDHIKEVAEMRKKECLDHINSLLKFAKLK